MTMMTAGDLRRLRLLASGLAGPKAADAAGAVGTLLAVQAQNAAGAAWSVGQRVDGGTYAAVRAAIAGRRLVLTWTMRGTLHLIRPEDASWLIPLLGARANTQQSGLRRAAGVTGEILARCTAAVTEVLQAGPASRTELLAALAEAGGPAGGASHVLRYLAQSAVIVFAPPAGRTHTFDLFDRVVPEAASLPRDEALARLALRYARGHGPVRPQDLAWWSGLTLGDARRAFGLAGGRLRQVADGGWHAAPEVLAGFSPSAVPPGCVHLLPGFDEYHIGYADRTLIMASEHRSVVGPAKNGLFRNVLLQDGSVAGIWDRDGAASVSLEWFAGAADSPAGPPDPADAVREYARFMGPGGGAPVQASVTRSR